MGRVGGQWNTYASMPRGASAPATSCSLLDRPTSVALALTRNIELSFFFILFRREATAQRDTGSSGGNCGRERAEHHTCVVGPILPPRHGCTAITALPAHPASTPGPAWPTHPRERVLLHPGALLKVVDAQRGRLQAPRTHEAVDGAAVYRLVLLLLLQRRGRGTACTPSRGGKACLAG